MKHKRLKIILTLLLGFGLTGVKAQTLHVKQSEGTETAYSLGDIRVITFSEGNLEITNHENSTSSYELSALSYLSFSDIVSGIIETEKFSDLSLTAYPNPVSHVLTIQLEDAGNSRSSVEILTISGRVLSTQDVTGIQTTRLNLSHLPRGIYLCRYRNSLTMKTVKIIKN
ncbi:MAG: T9SS type A sorting domain-containing protein [Bacteroidales bacterium]|nr:T9SS type A sorting domain-containing protein [Bacteroidales bacterium]